MSWDWEKLKQQQQGRGGVPPQMDEFVEKIKRVRFPGGPLFIVLVVLVALALTTFYTVKQNEVGVVQLFGRYVRTTEPGLNFKLPLGIEKVTKVNVREIQTAEFGFSTSQVNFRSRARSGGENQNESLMLTGDLNVAIVPWIVQFRIKNPFDYLFKVRDVRRLLHDMSEASMRLVVGDRSINEVISKRDEIAVEAKGLLQTELDQAETGIHVV
ncbi:MAG: protease modulator HflK, partial [Desulfobacterales bacterium]